MQQRERDWTASQIILLPLRSTVCFTVADLLLMTLASCCFSCLQGCSRHHQYRGTWVLLCMEDMPICICLDHLYIDFYIHRRWGSTCISNCRKKLKNGHSDIVFKPPPHVFRLVAKLLPDIGFALCEMRVHYFLGSNDLVCGPCETKRSCNVDSCTVLHTIEFAC